MLDFLRWLDAFDPEKDIGEAIPEAAAKVRCDEEGLTFSSGGTSVFQPQELQASKKPTVDLPVAIQAVKITRYGLDIHDVLGERTETRLLRQSEVGTPMVNPDPSYHTATSPAQRAFIRAKSETFEPLKFEVCPWVGGLFTFWHASQRALNFKIEDVAVKEANTNLIVEVGNALRQLSRAVGDNNNEIARRATRRMSITTKPEQTLRTIKALAERYIRRAGNDEELVAQEAESCVEEFCREAKMTLEDVKRFGALRLPNGKLIHRCNVVHDKRIHTENGDIRIGYTDEGETGQILSLDEIEEFEKDKAKEELDERRIERAANNAGKGLASMPVLLASDVHRPQRYTETEEIVEVFAINVVNRKTGRKRTLTIEGEHKARAAKYRLDRAKRVTATGMDCVAAFRRTFGGFWSEQPDGSFMKAHGIAPHMLPKDMTDVDLNGILRDAQPGSGWTQEDIGCYVEQAGEVTLVLAPDWVTMNVEFGTLHEDVAEINNLQLKDVASFEDRQAFHKLISARHYGRHDRQRFLRGKLRERVQCLRDEQGWTPKMTKVIQPLLKAGLDTFHLMVDRVRNDLKILSYQEGLVAWSFINALREELRAEAIKAQFENSSSSKFTELMTSISEATKANLPVRRKAVETCQFYLSSWETFLVKDELFSKIKMLYVK